MEETATMLSIWEMLFRLAPVVGVMAYWIWRNERKIDKLEDQKEALNNRVYDMAENNISTLKDVQITMDKVIEIQTNGNREIVEQVVRQCMYIKDHISGEVDRLKELSNEVNKHKNYE